jgi:DNA-binding CsgD family transcriptional regulator/tetratricopeptide (TPR) repeat protein
VDRSLVRFDQQSRYSLHPLMGQYLTDLLASDTDVQSETQARHAQYYYEWLIDNIPNIYRGGFFDDILQELDNIIQTWQWLVDNNKVNELEDVYWIYAELTNHTGNRMFFAENVYAYAKNHFETQADNKQNARILAIAQVLLVSSLSGGLFWHTSEHTALMRQAYDLAHYSGDPITIVIVGSCFEHDDDTSYAENVALVEQMPRTPLVVYALSRGYFVQQWVNRYDLPYEEALEPIHRLLEAAKQAGFASLLTRAYKLTAFLQLDRGYLEDARESFLKAMTLAEKSGHNEELYWGQSGLRWVYTHLDHYQDALAHNEKCLEFARKRNNPDGIRQYYQCLAINYRHMGNLEKSIDVFRKNVEHINTYAVSHIDTANTHSELAWTYAEANQYDLAQQHVDIAIQHVIQGTTGTEQWTTGFTGGIVAEIFLTSGMIAMHQGRMKLAVEWLAIGRTWVINNKHTHLLKKVKIALSRLEDRFENRDVIDLLDNVTDLTLEAAFAQLSGHEGKIGTSLVETLSDRELDVLALLAKGASNRDIARDLFITLGTVKRHVHNITGKLNVENRTQAALKAKELGLV